MIGVALDYLARHRLADRPCRFDVVSILFDRTVSPSIEVYQNAFDASIERSIARFLDLQFQRF